MRGSWQLCGLMFGTSCTSGGRFFVYSFGASFSFHCRHVDHTICLGRKSVRPFQLLSEGRDRANFFIPPSHSMTHSLPVGACDRCIGRINSICQSPTSLFQINSRQSFWAQCTYAQTSCMSLISIKNFLRVS